MKIVLTLFILIVLSALFNFVHANENVFTPANFTDAEQSLQNKIKFPNIEGDISMVIKCDSKLKKTGKFAFTLCFFDQKNINAVKFKRAIIKASNKAKIHPATLNGKNIAVYFQYSVEFIKYGNKQRINVYPNHNHDAHRFGKYYTSAQRYEFGTRFMSIYKQCKPETYAWVQATINDQGNVEHSKILRGEREKPNVLKSVATYKCEKFLEKLFFQSKFIPATHNNIAVPSSYLEAFIVSINFRS